MQWCIESLFVATMHNAMSVVITCMRTKCSWYISSNNYSYLLPKISSMEKSFLIMLLQYGATHSIRHPSTCTDKWHPTASTTLSHSLYRRKVYLQLRSKQIFVCTSPENFLATSGCFECKTYYIMALGWLKKENEQFWVLTDSGLLL